MAEVRKIGAQDLQIGEGTVESPGGVTVQEIDARHIPVAYGTANDAVTGYSNIVFSVDDAISSTINVRAYLPSGYVTDGSVEYTTQIQSALDAAAGSILLVPEGTWQSDTLTIPGNTTIILEGTIKAKAGMTNATGVLFASGKSNIKIIGYGGGIDGNRTNQGSNGIWPIWFQTVTKSIIYGVNVASASHHSVYIDNNSNYNVVEKCHITDPGVSASGVFIYWGSSYNKVRDNTIIGPGTSTQGIMVDASTVGGGGVSANENLIEGNTVSGFTTGILVEDSHGNIIDNNHVFGQSSVCILVQDGQDNTVPTGTRVTNNEVGSTTAASNGINIRASKTLVAGNTVKDLYDGSYGIKVASGSYPVSNIQILNNMIYDFDYAGIQLDQGDVIELRGNIIDNTTIDMGIDGSVTGLSRSNNRLNGGEIQGRATLVAGTVTVSTTEVVAADNIQLTNVVSGGTIGILSVGTITAGTSFVINSSSNTDTSVVFWQIVH
jgi:parallel beta-helix repeat protein